MSTEHCYVDDLDNIKMNEIVLIGGRPLEVLDITRGLGKYNGHRSMITCHDINSSKIEEIVIKTRTVSVPFVQKKEYELLSMNDHNHSISYMDDDGGIRDQVIPECMREEEWVEDLKRCFINNSTVIVCIMSLCGEDHLIGYRTVSF